ncbi:hypothetical protein P3W45_000519 [Vairimorpha bombi]|jgi:hypothetical protein
MQNKKDDTTFWCTGDDSDDDFETLINSNIQDSLSDKDPKEGSILSSEKMDFLWSDDEEENEFSIGNRNETLATEELQETRGVSAEKSSQDFRTEENESGLTKSLKTEESEAEIIKSELNEEAKFPNIDENHDPKQNDFEGSNTITNNLEKVNEFTEANDDMEKFELRNENDMEADNFFSINKETAEENEISEQFNALNVSSNINNSTGSFYNEDTSYIDKEKEAKCVVFDNGNEGDDNKALNLFNIKEEEKIDSDLEAGIKNLSIVENDLKINKEPVEDLFITTIEHSPEVSIDASSIQNLDFLLDENDDDQEFFFDNIKIEKEVSNDNKAENKVFGNPHVTVDSISNINDELCYENVQQIDKMLNKNISYHEETDLRSDEKENVSILGTESVEKVILPKGPIDLFKEKPITCFLNNGIFTYYRTKQKRISKQGDSKDFDVNIFNFFKLSNPYELQNIDITNLNDNKAFSSIYKVLALRDIHGDSISEVIGARDVTYTLKSQVETQTSSDINSALNISNINKEMAVDYCMSKKMWTLALILSNNSKNVVSKVLSEMLDDSMMNLILDGKFVMEKPWIEYFKHFINSKYSDNHDKYIKEVYKSNIIDGFFVIISFHLCKIIDIKNYLYYFIHNSYLLEILIYINQKLLKIDDIDILLYGHILDVKDRNILYAKEFYKIHKKEFKKELQTRLDEVFNLNWNFGIKDVLNFGINRILDVQETEPTNNKTLSENTLNKKNVIPKKNLTYHKQNIQLQTKMSSKKASNSDIIAEPIKDVIKKEVIVAKNLQTKEVYTEQKHSKSFADFFENDKEEKEITTEDDTSLFLSKYNIEDDEKVVIKQSEVPKPEDETNNSFFNIFGLFKKKSYKVDLQATDDIKYDPVTKKWVTSGYTDSSKQSNASKKSVPVPKAQLSSLLKSNMSSPDLSNNKPEAKKVPVDLKKMSLYAGKKKSSTGGFSTLKKDNNQN